MNLDAIADYDSLNKYLYKQKIKKTYGEINSVFDRLCSNVVFDTRMAQRVIGFQIGFVNKNEDHVAFFGGCLTGVEVVRMTSTDMSNFFSDVLQINEIELETELHALQAIKADRKVSGDVFNHVCLWCVHKFLTSELPPAAARRAALAAALILQYRYLTSLLSWYYKHPADPDIASASYARLTKKTAIKRLGSWHAVLEERCDDLLPPDGLHYPTVKDYTDDYGIIYALNDSQGRIRSMMKHLISELITTRNAGARVKTTSSTIELDGVAFWRDRTNGLSSYEQYIFRVIPDEHTFIKQDILSVIGDAVHTAPLKQVQETLQWITANFKTTIGKNIDVFIHDLLVHSFNYLADNRTIMSESNDIAALVMRLKGVYMGSKSTDPLLLKIRDLSKDITTLAIKSRNPSVIAAVRTAVMLYIVIRAFTKNHYSK